MMFILKHILDFFFPLFCLGCSSEGLLLCARCLASIPLKKEQVCPICLKHITPSGNTCFSCKNKTSIDGVFAACSYKEKLLSRSIHAFKYEFLSSLGKPLSELLITNLADSKLPIPDIIVPVPLHPLRLRWRGFNQSEVIARYLAENLLPGEKIPMENILKRIRFTRPQMKTKSKEERKENLTSAFRLMKKREKDFLKGKYIWLVDDVTTTGTTLEECARILKKSGAKEVFGIVLAR